MYIFKRMNQGTDCETEIFGRVFVVAVLMPSCKRATKPKKIVRLNEIMKYTNTNLMYDIYLLLTQPINEQLFVLISLSPVFQ